MDPPPAFSDRWALRLIAAAGITRESEKLVKKVAKGLEKRTTKEIAKKIIKRIADQLEKNLDIGWNEVLIEIVDTTNLLGMLYTVSGFSIAVDVGCDLTVVTAPGEWFIAKTTKSIQIGDFDGYGRHTGGMIGLVKSISVDYVELYGPKKRGADSLYVKFVPKHWDELRLEGSLTRPALGAGLDTEPFCSVDAVAGPYPITAEYVDFEDDEDRDIEHESKVNRAEPAPQELPDPPDISDLVKR
jgi:hypothetical protein